jgi:anti-anti-sigma factor
MLYNIKSLGVKTDIELTGSFNFSDYNVFREIMKVLEEQEVKLCSFDLSQLEFIDSAGLGMLLIARDLLIQKNARLSLQGAHTQVKKMLDLGRLDSFFTIED